MAEQSMALRKMGLAALAFLGVAIISVLGIIVLEQFKTSTATIPGAGVNGSTASRNATLDAWIAAIVIFGTFATIIALVIVTKVIIDIVKTLQQ